MVIKYDGKEIEVPGFRNLVNCVCGTTVLITDENNVEGIEFSYRCKGCDKTNSFKYSIDDFNLTTVEIKDQPAKIGLQKINKLTVQR